MTSSLLWPSIWIRKKMEVTSGWETEEGSLFQDWQKCYRCCVQWLDQHSKITVCTTRPSIFFHLSGAGSFMFMLQSSQTGMCTCMYLIGQCSALSDDVGMRCSKSWARFKTLRFFANLLCWNPRCTAELTPFKWMKGLPFCNAELKLVWTRPQKTGQVLSTPASLDYFPTLTTMMWQ